MVSYYALYKRHAGTGPPVGLFVLDERTGDALLWSHRSQCWRYDPDLVVRVLDDPENWDRFETVDRAAAEVTTMVVTRATEALPDEPTIRWLFHWKGRPPGSKDLTDELGEDLTGEDPA